MQRLALVLILALAPVVVAALALGAYLNYGSIRQSYLDMVGSRLDTVARRVASDAETALSLGLPLAGQQTLARLLERERAADSLILSIDVVDPANKILHSSDPDRIGTTETPDASVSEDHSVAIRNAFETVEGQVVVRASKPGLDRTLAEMARPIWQTAIVAIVVALILSALAVILGLRLLRARVTQTEAAADGLVPRGSRAAIVEVDAAHRAIADRLAGSRAV
ncbi:hypothetical protein [Amorphus sp. 3PC139-8]|uniref:hypothetical protein n=1 Tax=Amorphus sp. 3PC139-8 TaxID=2735676 RepID=UPI00345CD178